MAPTALHCGPGGPEPLFRGGRDRRFDLDGLKLCRKHGFEQSDLVRMIDNTLRLPYSPVAGEDVRQAQAADYHRGAAQAQPLIRAWA
jgi:hypothetical protein